MHRIVIVLAATAASGTAFAAVCPTAVDLNTVGPAVASGDTTLATDDYAQSCGSVGSTDEAWEFTAPSDGSYTFDTFGSAFDTTLVLIDTADCATELDCNDDYSGLQSLVGIDLLAGESVLVVVSGYSASQGTYVLNVTLGALPVCTLDVDLGTSTGFSLDTGTTCGGGNDAGDATCASGQDSEDVGYAWTAPSDGTFKMTTNGSTYDTAMTVQSIDCSAELACDDDGGSGLTSTIYVDALAGEEFLVVVDGFSSGSCGDYVLSITDESVCPDVNDNLVCDGNDLQVAITTPIPGSAMTFTATNATPGAFVRFFVAPELGGTPTCHPVYGTACLGIRPRLGGNAPILAGNAIADNTGTAVYVETVLRPLPSGGVVFAQAIEETLSSATVSNIVSDVVP